MVIYYNISLLNDIINRDNCKVDINDLKGKRINRDVVIEFICICGQENSKGFRVMYEHGAFCKSCSIQKGKEKAKETCCDKYGVSHPGKSDIMKQKIKETNLKRYGVEYSFQSEEVKKKIKETVQDRYGVAHALQNEEIRNKVAQTNIKKYGVVNVFQNEGIKDKIKVVIKGKYGVENVSQSQEIINKKKETMMKNHGVTAPLKSEVFQDKLKRSLMDRYGFDNPSYIPEFKEKKKETWLAKYGVDNPFKSPEIKDKISKTIMDRYGVDNPTKNPEILERQLKSGYKTKLFAFPSGFEAIVQGYEHHALKILVSQGYTEDDIITRRTQVPNIEYVGYDDKVHRYFTDIYLPKENRMIEVKSTFTYDIDKEKLNILTKVCKELDYKYEIWVFDRKLELTIL
jgi:hypothetical protein